MPHVNVYDTDNDLFFKHKTAYPPRLTGIKTKANFQNILRVAPSSAAIHARKPKENHGRNWKLNASSTPDVQQR